MSEWKTYKLDRVCKKITDGTHFSPKEMPDGKRIIATVRDMSEYGFAIQNCKRISEEDYLDAVKNGCRPEKGDVLFSKDGTMGIVQFFKGDVDLVLLSSIAILKPDIDIIDGEYLAYYLKNPQTNNFIKENFKSGSALPRIVLKDLKKFELHIPSTKNTQKKIASILSSLDDKIELNLQMNQTLEAMAQAIFKEWFVPSTSSGQCNFNFPGFDGELVDGLPKGWKMGKFEELIDIKTGKGLKREEFNPNGNYSIIGANGELGRTDKYLFEDKYLLTGRVGTLGSVKISFGKKWYSDNVLLMKPTKFFYYTYQILLRFDMQSLNRGSTQPLITQTDLKNHIALIPETKIVELYEKTVFQLYEKIFSNDEQNQTLTQIRDSLLPKLMTGKISLNQDLQD